MLKENLGILLLGGTGSRLAPLTMSSNKHLLPIYNKPMFYYSLSTIMLAGIRDILIICNEPDVETVARHFDDGSFLGLNIEYAIQRNPNGIPEGFEIAFKRMGMYKRYLLCLGDNILYGNGLSDVLRKMLTTDKANILGYKVRNPADYGVLNYENGNLKSVVEKPKHFVSNDAVIGVYSMPYDVVEASRSLTPSERGETEISHLINYYIEQQRLEYQILARGFAWFDTGQPRQLLEASSYVEALEERQNLLICSPEEIAFRLGYIDKNDILSMSNKKNKSQYYDTLRQLL